MKEKDVSRDLFELIKRRMSIGTSGRMLMINTPTDQEMEREDLRKFVLHLNPRPRGCPPSSRGSNMSILEVLTTIRERVETLEYLEYDRIDARAACEQIRSTIDRFLKEREE